jgi:DNA repair protein RadA/Sms
LAVVSSFRECAAPARLAAFGEVGLAGEVRAVDMARQRVTEAAKFGFNRCILPRGCAKDVEGIPGVDVIPVAKLQEAIEALLEM